MDPMSLHTLMDAAVDGQRKDIYDYTFGHLNYARCGKTTSDDEPKLHWSASVRKKTPQGNPLRVKTEEVNKMTEALFDFSSGTTGAISNQTSNVLQEATSSVTIPPPPQEQLEKNLLEEMQRLIWKNSDSNLLSSPKYEEQSPRGIPKKVLPSIERSKKIVCEELKLPEIMLPVMDDSANIPPSMQVAASKQFEKKRFVTTYHAGVSLKDQFQKMMDFDRTVLKKPDTIERKVGDGHKAVEHLE
uniref:Uncharacterized protein n=1 Tax=Ciona savignyi TaxID=51511 RepID=H2Y3V7_CIOSA